MKTKINKFFKDKSILITGGTGSLGKKIIKHLLINYKLKKIIIYSRDELKQYDLKKELQSYRNNKVLRFFIGDVRDYSRLEMAMNGVDYVLHAAALKHIDVAEYNPYEFIKTNILGGNNVVHAAIKNNVKKIIALSTDKACDPINLYGATKLTSDKLFISSNNIVGHKSATRFSVVRYGNVLGSRGSVIPFFLKLKNENKKTLPITHHEMTRFLISLDQAIDFIFNGFLKMKGGEIFVPKIPSVKIIDLAKSIYPKAKLDFIGKRPGEKMHEVMCSANESENVIEFKNHYVIKPSIVFFDEKIDYLTDKMGERGKKVTQNFEYSSGNQENFLNSKELEHLLKKNNFI